MTADELAGFAGILLSLGFSYIPSAEGKWNQLSATGKRLVMLGLLLLVALAATGIACAGFAGDFGLLITCDRVGVVGVVRAFMFAAVANQTVYALSPVKK